MSMTPLSEIDAVRDTKLRQQFTRRVSACEARFRDFIMQGIGDGSIRDCDARLTSLFILGASRHMMQWYNPDEGQDLRTLVERFIEFCCTGLVPGARQ
jgi:hypothetical protein